jgi:GNAT superfamily N-acetyltransferase
LAVCDWIESLRSERRRQIALVVVVQQQAVGLVEVSIEHHLQRPPFAIISALVVEKRFQNRGFRRLLCARAEDWAWMHGVQAIRATSHKSSVESHRFYLENGFHETTESVVFEKPRPH